MHRLVKKAHMYIGLLNFSILLVFGIAGLSATVHHTLREEQRWTTPVTRPFNVPPNATDRQVADAVRTELGISLAGTIPDFALKRDPSGLLVLDFWSVNGVKRATVLEKENLLRIEDRPTNLAEFLDGLHSTTAGDPNADWRIRMWAWYVELGIWSLLAMTLSGLYLWLATRPRHRVAQLSFAAGMLACITLFAISK